MDGGGGVWVVIAVFLIFNVPLIVYFLRMSSSFLQHQAVRVVGQIAINDCFAQASSFLMSMYISQYDSSPCQFFWSKQLKHYKKNKTHVILAFTPQR